MSEQKPKTDPSTDAAVSADAVTTPALPSVEDRLLALEEAVFEHLADLIAYHRNRTVPAAPEVQD